MYSLVPLQVFMVEKRLPAAKSVTYERSMAMVPHMVFKVSLSFKFLPTASAGQ
jgi:hypothetical protein